MLILILSFLQLLMILGWISIVVTKVVEVVDVIPDGVQQGGVISVGNALLGAVLPYDGSHLRIVDMVYSWKQVVLDVVVEATIEPAEQQSTRAGSARYVSVQEGALVVFLGFDRVGGVVYSVEHVNHVSQPLVEAKSHKEHASLENDKNPQMLLMAF